MPVDIAAFRVKTGGDLKKARESVRARGGDEKVVDEVVEADKAWRKALNERQHLQSRVNKLSKEVGKLKRQKLDAKEIVETVKAIKLDVQRLAKEAAELKMKLDETIEKVGNWVHPTVPRGSKDKLVRKWGTMEKNPLGEGCGGPFSHSELLEMIDGYDPTRGCNVAGTRGYFLKGYGMLLNQALQMYATRFLVQRGYTPVQTPVMIRRTVMAKVAQLSTFDEDLYKVTGGKEEMYLAATSEQPLCALHANETLVERSLPRLYCGLSTCFRKELTSHGVDSTGVFRVHQFEKVEQFGVCLPSESWKLQERFLATCEEFYQSLNIPYRIVNIASESLSKAAAKKYDLEGWFPSQTRCRELVSCSNCTDYQSRALKTKAGHPKLGLAHTSKTKFVHLVNSTLCASQRTLCCLLENSQTIAGIRVPDPLVLYVGTSFIPFSKKQKTKSSKKSSNEASKKTSNGRSEAIGGTQDSSTEEKQHTVNSGVK